MERKPLSSPLSGFLIYAIRHRGDAYRIVQHIVELQYHLCQVENNLQYIKVTQALKRSLEKFYDLLKNDQKLMSQYQSTYIGWFYTGLGHSLYDRVCNSLIEYRNGRRPFDNVH